ncbi:MAG: hypothetical protein WAM94_18150 [Chromatiaceae bacterium]
MSGRPPGVKVGDRVRITSVHTGIVTELDDDGFKLLSKPGRPVVGSFHGDGEMTWVILPPPLPPEPPQCAVMLDRYGGAWQRVGGIDVIFPWYCTKNEPDQDWADLNRNYGPLTLVAETRPC